MCSCSLVQHGFPFLFLSLAIRRAFAAPGFVSRMGSSGVWVSRGRVRDGGVWGNGTAKGTGHPAPDAPFPRLHRWPELLVRSQQGDGLAQTWQPWGLSLQREREPVQAGPDTLTIPMACQEQEEGLVLPPPWKTALEGRSLYPFISVVTCLAIIRHT